MHETTTLLDIRGLIFHSYFAGKDPEGDGNLRTAGFCLSNFLETYLLPITEHTRLNRIIAVKDDGHDYRSRLFPDYKKHRREREQDPAQIASFEEAEETVLRFLTYMGIPSVSVKGTEADDIVAHFAQKLPGPVFIYSVDNDLVQLVNWKTHLFLKAQPVSAYKTDAGDIPPELVVLYKSLCGDKSDGYGGVPGFGPAKWRVLEAAYGLDGLAELAQIPENKRFGILDAVIAESGDGAKSIQLIRDNRTEWLRSYALAKLNPDLVGIKGNTGWNTLRWHKRLPSADTIQEILAETGCQYLLPRLRHLLPTKTLVTADKPWDWKEMVAHLLDSPYVALDWETSTIDGFDSGDSGFNEDTAFDEDAEDGFGEDFVDIYRSRITGAGITFGRDLQHTVYVSFDHADTANLDKADLKEILSWIPNNTPVAVHQARFERTVAVVDLGQDIPNLHDTHILSAYTDENHPHGLKDLSARLFSYEQLHYEDVIEPGKKMRDYSAAHVFDYGADDPFVTAHLYDHFRLVGELEGWFEFVRANEFPSMYVLSDAYIAGCSVDWDECERQGAEDAATKDASILTLRRLIRENQTEDDIQKGFLGMRAEWLQAAKLKKNFDEAEVADALQYAVKYREPSRVRNLPDFRITKAGAGKCLETVSQVLGVEPYAAGKTDRTEQWQAQANEKSGGDARVVEFTRVYREWYRSWVRNNREVQDLAPEYKALEAFCVNLLWENLPEEKQWVTIGTELNLNSPNQNQILLYGMLGLPVRVRNFKVSESRKAAGFDTGSAMTNKDAIAAALADDCPEGDWRRDALLALKEAKTCDTRIKLFYSKLPKWKYPDGLIRPGINQCGTKTRRPSGSSPNLFNLPKKEEGLKLRKLFIPNERLGHDTIFTIDWSTVEVRLAALLSQDPALLSCYVGDDLRDVHSLTAAKFNGVPYDAFQKVLKDPEHPDSKRCSDMRKTAKNVNFGSQYGVGAAKLARMILIPTETAQEYLESKKALYAQQEEWRGQMISRLNRYGYLETLYGTRRHLHKQLVTDDDGLRSSYERQGVNFLIQSLAACLLKATMAEIHRRGLLRKTGAVLFLPLYDELAFSLHHSQAERLVTEVFSIMTRSLRDVWPVVYPEGWVDVPIMANPAIGRNFGDMLELGDEAQAVKKSLIDYLARSFRGHEAAGAPDEETV